MPGRAYITRTIERALRRASRQFPAVMLTGPRQCGKTTTLRRLFGKSHDYVSLEPPDVVATATADPRGFLARHAPPVIFDELQYAPVLLPYIKEIVDRDGKRGQFLLTGSQNLLLMQRVTETLAGRAAVLNLYGLTRREIDGSPDQTFAWEKGARIEKYATPPRSSWEQVLRGNYPEVAAHPRQNAALWHSSYIRTYLERDVRGVRQVGDLSQFQAFLTALAARTAQLLDLSELSRDLGIAVNTVKAWLSVLETSFQVVVVRPYFANIGKRLVKTPKIYFLDPGTLCHLVGVRDAAFAATGPMAGAIFETVVASEIYRGLAHRGVDPHLYFWRTSQGTEVDLVVDTGSELVPVEVKVSQTPRPAMALGIASFRADMGARARRGYVVHPGDSTLPLGPDAVALPFSRL